MLLIAAILSFHLDLSSLFGHHGTPATPAPTCHITTVSHKFVGEPGMAFRYAGEKYEIPHDGWIELIAAKGVDQYEYLGRPLPLNVFPRDEFGAEVVRLPKE